jgi:hypothetical protein
MNRVPYYQVLTPSGGQYPYVFSLTSGSLPPGINFSSAGVISGDATIFSNDSYAITFSITDAQGCVSNQALSVMADGCPTITLPASLPNGTQGQAYSQQVTTTGGVPPDVFSLISGSLPPGLNLFSNGLLAGTPVAAGTYNFTLAASEESFFCSGTQAYAVTIASSGCSTISLSTPELFAEVGLPYVASNTITASGGTAPYTFQLLGGTTLPPGLSLSSSGTISGTPTSQGSYPFIITAIDANNCTGSKAFTISVSLFTQWH